MVTHAHSVRLISVDLESPNPEFHSRSQILGLQSSVDGVHVADQ